MDIEIFENNSKKQKILEIIHNNKSSSAKKIHNELRKKFIYNQTYQSTYKLLNEFSNKKILIKNNFEYQINYEWVNEQKKLLEKYSKDKELKFYSKDLQIYEFDSLKELDNFIQEKVLELNNKLKEKETYWKTPHCWWLIAYPIEEDIFIEKYTGASLLSNALITNNCNLDKKAKEYYETKKIYTVKIKNDSLDREIIQVIGDYVFQCEIPLKIYTEMHKIYINNENCLSLMLKLISDKNKIELKILNNSNLAKMYKNLISN